MKRLYVFADFDWLKEPRLIGELSYESLRGSDSHGFCYSNEWLKDYGSLFLSDDLNNYPGQQYTAPGKDIFGCFSDALPGQVGAYIDKSSGTDSSKGRETFGASAFFIRLSYRD